jgi:hypothetical protein
MISCEKLVQLERRVVGYLADGNYGASSVLYMALSLFKLEVIGSRW